MSIQIPCAHCGNRPVQEFIYGEIPSIPTSITDEAARDVDFGFMHNNVAGVQREAWFHSDGCRRWTYLERDTVTDVVVPPAAGTDANE